MVNYNYLSNNIVPVQTNLESPFDSTMMQDPNDDSGQYAIDARELYQYNNSTPSGPGFAGPNPNPQFNYPQQNYMPQQQVGYDQQFMNYPYQQEQQRVVAPWRNNGYQPQEQNYMPQQQVGYDQQYMNYPYQPQSQNYMPQQQVGYNQQYMNYPYQQEQQQVIAPWGNNGYNGYQQQQNYMPQQQVGYDQQYMNYPQPQQQVGSYGYIGNPTQQYLNQQQGIGYNQQGVAFQGAAIAPMQQQPNGYNQWMQQQQQAVPWYAHNRNNNNGGYINIGMPQYQQPVYYRPQYQDVTITVPGYNPLGGTMLLPSDAEEICEQMTVDMMLEMAEVHARRQKQMVGGIYTNNPLYGTYGSYNGGYYGGYPSYNGFFIKEVYDKYMQQIAMMRQEAKKKHVELNKRLSRMCHSYLNDDITDEDIDRLYDGYTYTIPGAKIQSYDYQDRLAQMVPFDNSEMYRNLDAAISRDQESIFRPDTNDLNEFFIQMGYMNSVDRLEEEEHRRKDYGLIHDQNIYSKYIINYSKQNMLTNKAIELANMSKGDIMKMLAGEDEVRRMANDGITISDDGTINISAPEWMVRKCGITPIEETVQMPTITNEMESENESKRQTFFQSVYIK